MTQTLYDPENWLLTMIRGLKDYAQKGFKDSVLDDNNQPVGDQVYDVVMEFPTTDAILKSVPLGKAIVHFEIDEIDDRILGFGVGEHRLNYDAILKRITPQEAGEHRVALDVGVWTSDRSGGLTTRLRAYQTLKNLFMGALALQRLRSITTNPVTQDGGLEILEFTGGRFLQETINDLIVYRMVDCNLTVRCYSRTPLLEPIPTIEDITIIPDLIIDQNLHIGPDNLMPKDYATATENATKTP